jgi:ABC-type nitrate/sulfonate/bicarbonate transport system permease component
LNAALRGAAAALAPFAVILVLWQLAAKFAGLPPSLFPPLESIFAAMR